MKKYTSLLLSLLVLATLSGCGQEEEQPASVEAEEVVQWKTEGFAEPKELEVEQVFWAGQYQPWEHEEQASAVGIEEWICLDSGVYGEVFWYLGSEPIADGESALELDRKYVLEIYDTVKGEASVSCFSPEEIGLEGRGILDSMDMLDREHFVFRWLTYEQNEEGMYHQIADSMVYTDLAGELQTTDFRTNYLDKGLMKEQFTELPLISDFDWGCDGKGNIYVIDRSKASSRLYLWNKSGAFLLERKGKGDAGLREPLRTVDGELIFAVYEENSYDFLWVNTTEQKLQSLARIEASKPYIEQIYGMLENDIYYRSSEGTDNGIVRWNIKDGSRVQVINLETAGISIGHRTMLALREGQSPCLRVINAKGQEQKEWIAELTAEKPTDEGAVRVADFTGSGELVEKCVALASMENPSIRYLYENASAQEAQDRITAEFLQGKGPDFLLVSLEDLYVLQEKGLLMDIGELISPEMKEELLPGVLEIGTVDEKLYGIPTAIRVNTLMVSESTWDLNTWRLEDIIGLMEEGTLTGAVRSPFIMSGKYLQPFDTVISLIGKSLGDSFLIDWENRRSHFDDERFVKLLELTTADMSRVSCDEEAWLDDGKSVAWGCLWTVSEFLDFFGHMEKENGKIIGYPTNGSVGSYLTTNGGVLVVNANAKRKDAVTGFLEILFSDEHAKDGMLSIRKLVPEDYIVEKEDGRLLFMGNDRIEIPVFSDGTTALDRAKVFLESCVAEPPSHTHIIGIIREELDAMYTEKKSPQTTAEIINSRVQLYLDEGDL